MKVIYHQVIVSEAMMVIRRHRLILAQIQIQVLHGILEAAHPILPVLILVVAILAAAGLLVIGSLKI
jgi:hypothetical protein